MTSSGPKKLNPKLFAPFLRKFIKKRNDKYFVKEMKTLKVCMLLTIRIYFENNLKKNFQKIFMLCCYF